MKKINQEYIDILAEELDRGKLVVFVGAGISMGSGLPSWSKLVEKYSERLNLEKKNYTSDEILLIPEIFYDKFGKIKYYEILDEIFGKKMKPNKIHEKLDDLSPNYIITTNYDSLVEDKLNEDYTYDVIVKEEELAYSQSNKMIVKMHGDLKNKNIVLKKGDYDNYEKDRPLITTFVKSLFTTNTVLFIGYSLNDVNVKNIMNWISEILKDDFRRVYLADLSESNPLNKYENNQNKLVNRIFLGNDSEKDKGKLVADFLEEISKTKEEINENLKGKFYENLNYVTNNQFKKIIKAPFLSATSYKLEGDSSISEKNITLKSIDKIDEDSIVLAVKSNIIKIEIEKDKQKINIMDEEKNKAILEKTKKNQGLEKKIIELLFKFDYNCIEELIEKNKLKNIQLLSYFYFVRKNYSLAKKNLKETLEVGMTNELKLWNLFIISNIEKIEKTKVENILNKDKKYYDIDLKKEYHKSFKNIYTNLHEEIFNNKTLNEFRDEMNRLKEKTITDRKSTTLGGFTPVVRAQILIRDFFNYCFFNGFIFKGYKEAEIIFKDYLEIIFMSYTNNKIDEEDIVWGEINKIKSIDYLSIYVMLHISDKYLKTLFEEHKISELLVEEESVETFIVGLKNYLEVITSRLPSNIFIVLNKLKLNSEQLLKILPIIIRKEILNNFSSDNINLFYKFIDKYAEEIPDKNFEVLLLNVFSMKNHWLSFSGNILIQVLTYHGKQKKIKIKDGYLIETFLKNNDFDKNLEMKLNFTQIADDKFMNNIKSEALESLDKSLEITTYITIYTQLLELKIISYDKKYEDQIIAKLIDKFSEKDERSILLNTHNYLNLTSGIIYLNFGNLSTDNFKNRLKNLNNETLDKCLRKQNYFNLWYYILEPESFDLSKFTIKDFELLTVNGLKGVLERDESKQIFNLLEGYVIKKYDDKFLKVLLRPKEVE